MNWFRHPAAFLPISGVLGMATIGALALSCASKGPRGQELYAAPADLEPFANPGDRASLILFSTEIPVAVDYRYDGKDLTLRLLAFNEQIEEEKYRLESSKFLLAEAAGERFDPPLPLLSTSRTAFQLTGSSSCHSPPSGRVASSWVR